MVDFTFRIVRLEELRRHEEVDPEALRALRDEISRDGELRCPVIVDDTSRVILDGHHRVSALRDLGCRLVPAYLVDYEDPRIVVGAWRPDLPVTKEDVVRAGSLERLYPPKTSRHLFAETPGTRPVPLSLLR